MSGDRELDVVVFGATGFVGRLAAGYLAGHAPGGVRIGLAGRSQQRLAEVRAGLGATASDWPLLTADSADPPSLAALARTARVVVSTVGPYRAQGLALVQACAEAGTDYADLTGEVLFIRDSIDSCHDAAARSGARIVHCCGFDSVPSDLGVLLLHQAARAGDAGDLQDTTLVVTALRGGLSGGTLASLMGQQEEVRANAERRRVVSDPYALSPDRGAEPDLGGERDLGWARYDGGLRMWTGPFAMAGINTRVVRRSNALQGWAYGRRFRYREVTGFGAGPAAPLLAGAAGAAQRAAQAGLEFGPSRALLGRLLPAPGQGPGEKTRRTGYFRIQIHTQTSAGARYLAAVEAQGDPGYAATSVMLGEAALCLALDRDQLPARAGVLTPATAMGAALAARLRAAGHILAARQVTQLPRAAAPAGYCPQLPEAAMCEDHSPPAPTRAVLHDVEVRQPIRLEPVDSVEIVCLMDNVTDVFMPDQGPARRPGSLRRRRPSPVMAGGQSLDALIAEHGFSVLVTVRKGRAEHRVLFDAGVSPDGVAENMRRLDIDPGSIEAIVCSHGHFDHTTGIDGLIRAVGRPNMPVLIHPHFWRRRRVRLPGTEPQEIPSVSKRALEDAGFEVIEEAQPSFLLDGSVLVTGEVARTTGYEPGFPPQDAWLDGAWTPDPLVLDDQALMVNVSGKGLVVLTGCGHAGIVNICRYARRLTGDQPLYAAMGGFHLNGPLFEPLIPRVLDDLAEMAPQVLVPAHCTGWRAQHAMGRRFGEAFVPNTVGTRFTL